MIIFWAWMSEPDGVGSFRPELMMNGLHKNGGGIPVTVNGLTAQARIRIILTQQFKNQGLVQPSENAQRIGRL